jgi:tetratricopeptide (TPR) repeat protein
MTTSLSAPRELARFRRALKAAVGREDWAEVAALAEAQLAERPESAEAHYVLALAAVYGDDLAAALQAATRACELAADTADHQDLLAIVYGLAGDVNQALFHGKAAAGCTRRSAFARIVPETFPTLAQVFIQIREQPLLTRGLGAMERGLWTDAEFWLRQHLAFAPGCAEAGVGLGSSLLAQDQPLAAVEALRGLRHALPQDPARWRACSAGPCRGSASSTRRAPATGWRGALRPRTARSRRWRCSTPRPTRAASPPRSPLTSSPGGKRSASTTPGRYPLRPARTGGG